MTANQRFWLEELIDAYRGAASNERLWAKGASDKVQAQIHEENAEELMDFADKLATLLD